MFKCLPIIGPCGRHIDHIDRRHSKLEQVPDDVIRNFRTLEECRLDANQIKELPKNFFRLKRIRLLTLSDNELTRLPTGIGSFSNLVELDISRNDISELPESIRFCDSLQSLDVSNNPLQSLPSGFCQLRNLRVLCLNDISIAELPEEIGSLQLLEKLELRDNCLKTIPDSFADLINLEFLDLGANEFQELSPVIGQLSQLSELWIDDNELRSLPKELGNLGNLQQLDISENLISSLPESISGLVSLSDLNISQNSITHLPDGLGKCSSLQELYLTENFLSKLPSSIGSLVSMFHLNVDQNQLTELPSELFVELVLPKYLPFTAYGIGQCTSLNILSLRENNLHRLPNEIGDCTRLRVLDVSGNRLDRLPFSLSRCSLTALWLSQNQSQPVITLQKDIDPVTQEQYLTYPTMSPSELDSFSASVNPDTKPSHDLLNGISAEINHAYDPTDMHTLIPQSDLTNNQNIFPSKYELMKPPSKGFPKTRHPRSGKKATDNHFSSKGDPNHYENANTSSKTFSEAVSLASSSESLNDHYNDDDNAAQILISESLNHDHKSPKPINSNFYSSVYPHNVIKSSDMNSITTNNGDHITIGPIAKPRNKSQNITEAFDKKPSPSSPNFPVEDTTSKLSIGIGRPKLPIDSVIRTASEEDTSDSRSNRASPVKKFADTLDVRGNPDEDAYSSGGEEIYVISRRVGFTDDVEDNEEKSNQKLIRRDTPHYTKRARIQSKTADGGKLFQIRSTVCSFSEFLDGLFTPFLFPSFSYSVHFHRKVDSEEAVLKILEKYRASVSPNPDLNPADFDGTIKRFASSFNGALISPDIPLHNRDSHSPSSLHGQPIVTLQEKVEVHIHRQPNAGLGLSVAGGVGSIPFRGLDHGIFVSRLNPNGLAATSGLKLGDKLLEVNGVNLVNVEHHVAVAALRANTNYFRILVTRDIQASSKTENCKITNPTLSGTNLNMLTKSQVIGSIDTKRIPEAIYVSKITEGGAACKQGHLRVGDQIISINGIDVRNARHDEAISLLIASNQSVDLEILRYNSDENDNLSSLAKTSANGYITPPSVLTIKGSNDLQNIAKTTDVTSANDCTSEKYDSRVYLYNEKGVPVERITIRNDGGPLGLAICGGSDISCLPFGDKEPGIFISKISPDGAALNTGLRIGDRVLKVNGVDLRHATHDEAVQALIQPVKELQLEVRRDPPPPGLRIFREAKSILSCVVCDGPVEFALQISKTQSKNDESSTYSSAMPFTIIRSSMLANADASVDDNLTFNSQIEKASIYRLNPEAIIRD
ncbi:Protein scribble like [Schistosoma japonicum]|nr:Protein scribble like [Schistosoma japonicum]